MQLFGQHRDPGMRQSAKSPLQFGIQRLGIGMNLSGSAQHFAFGGNKIRIAGHISPSRRHEVELAGMLLKEFTMHASPKQTPVGANVYFGDPEPDSLL